MELLKEGLWGFVDLLFQFLLKQLMHRIRSTTKQRKDRALAIIVFWIEPSLLHLIPGPKDQIRSGLT